MPLFRKPEAFVLSSPVSELDFGTLSFPHSWTVLFKQQRGCQHTTPVSGAITALLCFQGGEKKKMAAGQSDWHSTD